MTSRERVLCAVTGGQADRTPRNFRAEPPALRRLLRHLGHDDEERMLRDFGVDLRHVDAGAPPEREIRPGLFQNYWGERYVYNPTPWGPMREDVKGALADADSLAELQAFAWPSVDDLDYSRLAAQCRVHADRALIYGFADVWQRPALVRGWEGMFLDMVLRPDWVHFLCRTFTDFYLADYTRAAETTGGRIDLYLVISDLGGQGGPFLGPDMFRVFVAPYLREMVDHIHALGARAMFHSCGAIHPFIPDLIEMGVDVLDPIQPAVPEMSPERLSERFGGRIAFHGGIDLQRVLTRGSPDDVRREVRRYCRALAPRYILAPAHLFQPDVPPENIVAFYE